MAVAPDGKLADAADDLDTVILGLVSEAENFSDNELSAYRERTWRFYNGEVDTPARPGRSRVVKTEVRDTVELMMPSMMSILMSSTNIVEFVATPPYADPNMAAAMTEEANGCLFTDNPGWLLLHDAVKESLLARSGVFKVYPDYYHVTRDEQIDPEDPMAEEIAKLGGAEIIEPDVEYQQQQDTAVEDLGAGKIARYQDRYDKICIEVTPAEELIIDKYARDAEDASIIGQRSKVRLGRLVEMGFSPEMIKELRAETDDKPEQEKRARTGYNTTPSSDNDGGRDKKEKHWALREITLKEVYPLLDPGNRGVLQRYKCFVVNDKVLHREPVKYQPYVVFSSIRIPHTAIGRCPGEHSIEFQEEGSAVYRQVMDNFYWSNNPALQVIKGAVNPYQVENWGFASIFDVKMPNAITPITIPFVGDKAISVLEWMEKMREARTGAYKDALGLNPAVLRGQTATAAQASYSQATKQQEMYARVIAETGIAELFKKYFEVKTGQKPRMGMKINVGLGNGSLQERFQALMVVAGKQEQIILSLGKDNPLCGLPHYAYTLEKLAELAPYYEAAKQFTPPEQVAQIVAQQQQNPQQPSPDPKMIEAQGKVQAHQQKTKADIQMKQVKLQMDGQVKAQELQLKQQAAAAKLQQDTGRATAETAAKIQQMHAEGASKMQLAQVKAAHEMEIARMKANHEMQLAELELQYETRLEAAKVAAQEPGGQGNIVRKRERD